MLTRAVTGVLATAQRRTFLSVPPMTPDKRRATLKKKIQEKGFVRAMEAHSGLSGLIVEHARGENGEKFDALWSSSLTSSTIMGKPDIETVDTTSRVRICDEILEVTSLPMIYDGDTGGLPEIFHFTVKTLERIGVSACIIEDKTGLKQNSLFGVDRKQQLADIDEFSAKIARGKAAQVTDDFLIFARLEALIAGYGHDEAMKRAEAYLDAGADGVMIHSKNKDPEEIFRFLEAHNKLPNRKMVVVVPTTYNTVPEKELVERGANIVIHANQLVRAAYPAMNDVAKSILTNGRSKETDSKILSVKDILTMIDDGTR
ncbi:Phosphoenolpyruvate phosphomutase [Diplonema papillatum]|nr:Phosphoenolpyruvate phosphomutase [Diplonema papillatum]